MIEIERLSADLKNAVKDMSKEEAAFLVKTYYTIQDERIGMFGRVRELAKNEEPNKFYDWLANQMEGLELRVKQALSSFSKNTEVGEWLLDICGIGPVIASGLIASLDITKGQNPSSFWQYAGLGAEEKIISFRDIEPDLDKERKIRVRNSEAEDWLPALFVGYEHNNYVAIVRDGTLFSEQQPAVYKYAQIRDEHEFFSQKRARGQKINFNPELKRLCFLIGESFVKVQSNKNDFYGKIFRLEKDKLIKKNEAFEFREAAEEKLRITKIGKDTEAFKWYSQGMLPPAHVHARARRFAVKIFLSHVWQVMWWFEYKTLPKMPWVLLQPGHSRFIEIPNSPF